MESGTPISISTESEDLFSMQRKTMMGTHLNYEIKKNFNIGGTVMYLQEKSLYQKVNYGEDPYIQPYAWTKCHIQCKLWINHKNGQCPPLSKYKRRTQKLQ